MKKLLQILGTFGIVGMSSATVISCGSSATMINPGKNEKQFFLENDLITVDGVKYNQQVFHLQTNLNNNPRIVKEELQKLFPNLKVQGIEVDLSVANKIVITNNFKEKIYQDGVAEIIYTDLANPTLDLDLVLKKTNLGNVDLRQDQWERFKLVVQKFNPLLDVEQLSNVSYHWNKPLQESVWAVGLKSNNVYKKHPVVEFNFVGETDLEPDLVTAEGINYDQKLFSFETVIDENNVKTELAKLFPNLIVDAISVDLTQKNKIILNNNPHIYYYRGTPYEILFIDQSENNATISFDLIAQNFDLGNIDLQAKDGDEFLAAIKAANPLVDTTQLVLGNYEHYKNPKATNWTVGFKENSIYTPNEFVFNFVTKNDLLEDALTKNNQLPSEEVFHFDVAIDQKNVREQLADVLPDLQVEKVNVDLSQPNKIIVSANLDIYYYREASFELIYTDADSKLPLDLVLTNTDLGQIDLQPSDTEQFLAAIKKQNPLVEIDQIVPVKFNQSPNSNFGSWTVKPSDGSIYSGKEVKFTFTSKNDLANDLPGYDQEVFKFNQPVNQENVLTQLKTIFPKLEVGAVNIDLNQPNKMVISANPDVYHYRESRYELLYVDTNENKQIDINWLLKTTDLGQIDLQPTDIQKFFTAIKKANPLIDPNELEPLEFSQGSNHETSTWTVGLKEGSIYKNETSFTFSFVTKNNLAADLITNEAVKYDQQVFKFAVALDESNVQSELTKLFPNLKVSDVKVAFTEKNVLTISANEDVYGYRSASYQLLYVDAGESKQIDINKVIKTTDLGEIPATNGDEKNFFKTLKKICPLLDTNQLQNIGYVNGTDKTPARWNFTIISGGLYTPEGKLITFNFYEQENPTKNN